MFRLLAALTALAIAFCSHAEPGSAANRPVRIDDFGLWTLSRLQAGRLDFSLDRDRERRVVPFTLPEHAQQGPTDWYLIRLHFTITFAERSRPGFAFISGLTNGHAAAQVEFRVVQRANGGQAVRWSTLDYIRGETSQLTKDRKIEIRFENYLQYRGLQAGRNLLAVQFERFTGVDVEALTIHPDSGIEMTSTGPAQLELVVEPTSQRVSQGEEFVVRYRVKNVGDRPALRVRVTPELVDQIELVGPRVDARAVLRNSLTGSFRLRAVKPGDFPLGIFVDSGTNHPGALVEVRVASNLSTMSVLAGFAPRVVGALFLLSGVLVLGPALARLCSSGSSRKGPP